jgi:hypothetical protein
MDIITTNDGPKPDAPADDQTPRSDQIKQSFPKALAKFFNVEPTIENLGFELETKCRTDEANKQKILERVTELDQSSFNWRTKLRAGALISHLGSTEPSPQNRSRESIIEDLSRNIEPGDIIFSAPNTQTNTLFDNIFKVVLRAFCAKTEMDKSFPFTHVAIVGPNGEIIEIDATSIKRRTLSDAFSTSTQFDAIAVGRINVSAEIRRKLAEDASTFLANKKYNLVWLISQAPWDLLLNKFKGREINDQSANKHSCVCIDVVTEPARHIERSSGIAVEDISKVREIATAVTPLDLFKKSAIKIVEAAGLHRSSKTIVLKEPIGAS